MELYVCGARGSCPVSGPIFSEFGGATTCYVVRQNEYAVVVDCGSGLAQAGWILAGCTRVDVLLTHLHYDHIIGLLYGEPFPKNASVRIFSNFDQWYGEESLKRFLQPPFWPYTPEFGELINAKLEEELPLYEGIYAQFRASYHPDGAMVLLLGRQGKSICFAFDYEHGKLPLQDWIRGCDLLIYDGMYATEAYPARRGWGHSTWEEGCRLAGENGVERLLISHHNPRSTDEMLRRAEREAKLVHSGAHFAREGEHFTV